MPQHVALAIGLRVVWLLFVMAFGACVGSLINVLVYRLPRGIGVVLPASRCPSCSTRLTWRDNIPIFGWVLLRGRCRYCRATISPEYPIVEACVSLLFGLFFFAYLFDPSGAIFPTLRLGVLSPEWARNDPALIWPTFTVLLLLLGSLVAMTLIDARTFTIPMELTTFPVVMALLVHPIHAAWIEYRTAWGSLPSVAPGWEWSIPTPQSSWWVGASAGAVVGLVVAALLVRLRLIRRSFEDYEAWEKDALAAAERETGKAERDAAPADMWIQYPHARREMLKELIYLAPALGLAMLGGWLTREHLGVGEIPLWGRVLTGVTMGFLIGGGVVWAVRIFGSLAFGKEAMGLGDVHLMAAVGAVVGWIDSVFAFFLAAFVGMAWQIAGAIFFRKMDRAMPYGPYLAVATGLVLLFKPVLETVCSQLIGHTCNFP